MISGHGAKFTQKLDAAIVALMSESSIEAAAKAAGIGVNTLYRWMKDKVFQEKYRETKTAAFSQSVGRLQQVSGRAIKILLEVMEDKKQPAGLRLRAADIILGYASGAEGISARAEHVGKINKRIGTQARM